MNMAASSSKPSGGTAIRDASDDDLALLLRALLDEVRGLRADLARPGRRPRITLLAVIATAVQGRAFSATEVFSHAQVNDGLATALDAAGITTARALGRYLANMESRVEGRVRVLRIGEDRDGLIWRCKVCQ